MGLRSTSVVVVDKPRVWPVQLWMTRWGMSGVGYGRLQSELTGAGGISERWWTGCLQETKPETNFPSNQLSGLISVGGSACGEVQSLQGPRMCHFFASNQLGPAKLNRVRGSDKI